MENVASKVLKRIEKMLEEKQSSLSVIQDLLKAEYEKEAEVKKEILNAQANMDFELLRTVFLLRDTILML